MIEVFGIALAGALLIKTLVSLYRTFLRPVKKLHKFGKWVVITGATDGIGKAYAIEFAKRGMSVVLISRTLEKLQQVKKEIDDKKYIDATSNDDGGSSSSSNKFVEVKCIVCDYSQFNNEKVRLAVEKELIGLDIGVLINNVGVSYRYPMYFHELSNDEVDKMLTLNIHSTIYMTRMILPNMIQRKQGGCIVNISSGSALHSLPLLAEYSGCKSFIEKFSRAINVEYNNAKYNYITCQCQVPFYVATKLAKMRQSITVPTPKSYAAMGIRWIGYGNECVVSPFYIHAIQGFIMQYCIPEFVLSKIINDMHLAIRKKGIAKDEKLANNATTKGTASSDLKKE